MRPHHVVLALASCFLFASLLAPVVVHAQWQPDGAPISTATNDQANPAIISDGAGGAIITWRDARSGNNDIYVQRVNASGVAQWTADGVPLCTNSGDQQFPAIVSDGAGGAIVTWHDNRGASNYDIFAQRVNASGAVLWAANGVALCAAANLQLYPTIVADGSGGAVVTWEDYRSATNYDIYAQRVNSAGVTQWTSNGVALCNVTNDQTLPTIAADGSGGAIVTWQDYRSGSNSDVYAQRVNSAGAVQWVASGVSLAVPAGDQITPTIIADGTGGAIVTWEDGRSGSGDDIYAQRVTAGGVVQWAANGVAICTAAAGQVGPTLVSDGSGGAIITWYDIRSGLYDVYAQRITSAGVTQWALNGVAVCTAAAFQYSPMPTTDGSGGAIITWYDTRNGTVDVYAQRLSHAGVAQWTPNGMPLCTAAGDQYLPVIAADGSGGAIVAWYDSRSGVNDVYAQRVEGRYGYWGHPEPNITSVADIRGDQGGKVKVNWKAGDWDALNLRTITHYSIWRATDVAAMQSAGAGADVVTDPSRIKADFKGKAYWIQHAPATDYYWEWVGNQNAMYLPSYSFSTDTRADSTSQSTATHSFMVFSQTADDYTFWPSNVVSGHSVDNLAPPAPLFLTALRVGADVHLRWNRVHVPDLKQYAIYRAGSTGVTPLPPNFLSNDTDTVLVDAGAPASALYYIVTAYDAHENQGKPSNEANVAPTTGVGNLPPITALAVLQNRPNPFAVSTSLEVGLPKASAISIEVFDVAGRRVRDVEMTGSKGWQQVPLSGLDDRGRSLASGVYFYRVHAAGTTITRKMVIAR